MKKSTLFLLALLLGSAFGCRKGPVIKSVQNRITDRDYPSVFQAWARADNLDEDPMVTMARHDLVFHSPRGFGLEWNKEHTGLADDFTPESIEAGKAFRQKLLELNPNMVMLAEIRYRDAPKDWLPEDHHWWMRDSLGNVIYGWKEGGFIRLALDDPDYQDRVAVQAAAAVNSGVVDGIMIDWWNEDEFTEARLAIVKKIRNLIGEEALIIANSNDRQIPLSAEYVNGLFMECSASPTPERWKKMQTTLEWADVNLRQPRINCLEAWFDESREDLHKMRATTTLALTRSDGYCLFSDPNRLPVPDHLHNWYPFWDAPLGAPERTGIMRTDSAWQRHFAKGTAVYNPIGNKPVNIVFNKKMKSMATGKVDLVHKVDAYDGDIFLSPPEKDDQ